VAYALSLQTSKICTHVQSMIWQRQPLWQKHADHYIDCTCVYILVVCRDKAYAAFHQMIRDFAQIRVGFLLALLYRWKCIFIHIYRIIGRDNPVYTVFGWVNPKMKNKDVFAAIWWRLNVIVLLCWAWAHRLCLVLSFWVEFSAHLQ